ncbi:hypothetical protein BDF21DRAFT_428709 [Thamnidium elegans]|nr:hypothetical protein BDF21DRAFT_428709 [Thamnidium elegans]
MFIAFECFNNYYVCLPMLTDYGACKELQKIRENLYLCVEKRKCDILLFTRVSSSFLCTYLYLLFGLISCSKFLFI